MRREATEAEKIVWKYLSRRQTGYYFRRQYPIGKHIADFACAKRRLIIELDGGQHASRQTYDEERTATLSRAGYRILRFWNHEVLENVEGVMQVILDTLAREETRWTPTQPSPFQVEG